MLRDITRGIYDDSHPQTYLLHNETELNFDDLFQLDLSYIYYIYT